MKGGQLSWRRNKKGRGFKFRKFLWGSRVALREVGMTQKDKAGFYNLIEISLKNLEKKL